MQKRTLPKLPPRLAADPQLQRLVEHLAARARGLHTSGSSAGEAREWLAGNHAALELSTQDEEALLLAWLGAPCTAAPGMLAEEVRRLTAQSTRGVILIDDFRVAHDDGFAWDEAGRREFQCVVGAIAPGVRWRFYSPDYAASRAQDAGTRAGGKRRAATPGTRGWGLLQFTRAGEELERLEDELPGVCRFAGFSLSTRGAVASTALREVRPARVGAAELLATDPEPRLSPSLAPSAAPSCEPLASGIRFQPPDAPARKPASRRAGAAACAAAPRPAVAKRRLTLVTFGFKYGLPNTNYYFDVSFVKNPARDPRWNLYSTPDEEMRRYVLEQPNAQAFLERLAPLLETLVECDDDVRVGLGCNSGRHRSIIVAEELARRLDPQRFEVRIVHREEEYR